MTALSFDEAVRIAKRIVAPQGYPRDQANKSPLTRLSEERAAICDTSTEKGYLEFGAENYGAAMFRENPALLLQEAEVDHFAFLALCRVVGNVVELHEPLPENAQLWLCSYLRGEWVPPKRSRGQPAKLARAHKIYVAVQYLVQLGLNPTRNDETQDGTSACDAVAKALSELGMASKSFSRVKEIYFAEHTEGGEVWVDPRSIEVK